jgi:hypothetical protein
MKRRTYKMQKGGNNIKRILDEIKLKISELETELEKKVEKAETDFGLYSNSVPLQSTTPITEKNNKKRRDFKIKKYTYDPNTYDPRLDNNQINPLFLTRPPPPPPQEQPPPPPPQTEVPNKSRFTVTKT